MEPRGEEAHRSALGRQGCGLRVMGSIFSDSFTGTVNIHHGGQCPISPLELSIHSAEWCY